MRPVEGPVLGETMTAFVYIKEKHAGQYAEYGFKKLGNQMTCHIAAEANDTISVEWGFHYPVEHVVELIVDGIVRQSCLNPAGTTKLQKGEFKTAWKCRTTDRMTRRAGAALLCGMQVAIRRIENGKRLCYTRRDITY